MTFNIEKERMIVNPFSTLKIPIYVL